MFSGNIRVFCRVRPLSEAEVASSDNIVDFPSDSTIKINKKKFEFDQVFSPAADQGIHYPFGSL